MRDNDKDHVINNDLAIYFTMTDALRIELRKMSVRGLLLLAAGLRAAEKVRIAATKAPANETPLK